MKDDMRLLGLQPEWVIVQGCFEGLLSIFIRPTTNPSLAFIRFYDKAEACISFVEPNILIHAICRAHSNLVTRQVRVPKPAGRVPKPARRPLLDACSTFFAVHALSIGCIGYCNPSAATNCQGSVLLIIIASIEIYVSFWRLCTGFAGLRGCP